MHTIAICGLKGGVGKTTLALNLGVTLWKSGKRILLVDADPQGSLSAWHDRGVFKGAKGPPVEAMAAMAMSKRRHAWGHTYEHVIIDTPPRLGPETRIAMMASDALILPVTPGPADAWAHSQTLALADEARRMRSAPLPAWTVVNRAASTTMTIAVARMMDELEASGRAFVAPSVRNYAAFAEAMARGEGVEQYEPAGNAAADIRRLAKLAEVRLS